MRDLERTAREADGSDPERNLVPITVHRARAHAANPYADPDDTVLFVAYEGGCCVGFIGCMPGRLRVGDRLEKMYWGSAYYVRPDRRAGVAMRLMASLLDMPYDLVLSAPSRVGERVYRGLGFVGVTPLEYLALRRNPTVCSRSLPARVAGRIRRMVRAGAPRQEAHESWDRFGTADMELDIDSWSFRPVRSMPPVFLLDGAAADGAFCRGPEVVDWMLSYPWIVEAREHSPSGYYFSDVRGVFRHTLLGASRGAEACCGAVALSLSEVNRSATLKVLDCALPPDSPDACVPRLARALAERFGVKRVDLSERYREAPEIFGASWTVERKQRLYFCRPHHADSPLARVLDRLKLDYCDGENPFL